MKKRILSLVLAVLMTAALCGCGGGKSEPAQPTATPEGSAGEKLTGGEITVGIAADLDTSLDPHASSSSAGTREVLFNIFEGLMKPDANGNLIPAIAEDCTVNEAADAYTYTLRQGVRFHNGKTVTVGDVVYSLTRAAGLETGEPLMTELKGVASVEAPDDRTIVVRLKAPDAEFNAYMYAAIIPEGNDPAAEVVGTGPFRFVSRAPQENVVLEKFADYWGEGAIADKVTLKVIPDPQTLVLSLRSGAVDMTNHLTGSQIADLEGLTLIEGGSNIIQALYLNNDFEPFRDVRVRQALCCAVDRQAVIDLASEGHGTPLGSSMIPAIEKYNVPELLELYKPDPEKAKALLKEAGVEKLRFSITVPSSYPMHVDAAQVIVEQLRAVGIEAEIKLVEWAAWYDEVYKGRKFEATVVGMDTHSLAASGCLARFQSENGKNFINFSDAEYDETYAKAMATVDEAEQTELFKRCETILAEKAANVYLQDPSSFAAMQTNIGGFRFYPALYVMDLATVYRMS